MKKILSFLVLALAFVACQNEQIETVSNSDLVEVMLTVDAPELGVTRADADGITGKNSALGAIDFFTDADWANYDLRYILEVYAEDEDGTGTPIYSERMVNCLDKYAPTTFALRLVPGRTYKFVVFADFVAEGNAEKTEPADKLAIADLYYNTADLRKVTAITTEPTWGAMNEVRDAYFVSENVDVTTGLNKTLTLTRPFAKLRVITTDLSYIAGYTAPGYVEVKYHTNAIYKSFNAVNGMINTNDVMANDELVYGFEVNKNIPYTAGYDAYETNQTLFTDYVIAPKGEQNPVNFEFAVYESKGGRLIHSHDFNTNIPVERNHLTTIIGDLLTTQTNITIEIDDNFEDEFVLGAGDGNQTLVNNWGAGTLNTEGDYEFKLTAEGHDFLVTINGDAIKNNTLEAGTYAYLNDENKNEVKTFTVEELQANVTTRALTAVEVIGGMMIVQNIDTQYSILLDLVLQFEEEKDVRHAFYKYEGVILFGETLDAPVVTATVEGNAITVAWEAVEDATSYFIAMNDEEAVETTELSKVYTDLAWETTYTFSVYAKNDTLVSVVTTTEATTEAEPIVPVETYNLYFNNLAGWSAVYAHIWANEGEDLGLESVDWPGRQLTETEELDGVTYYVFSLPAEATGKTLNVVFNDGNGTQTKDLSGVVEGNLFFDNYVEPVAPSEVVLYLQPNANWNVDGARFAAYFFGNGETWVDMTLVEGETNIYAVTVPTGFENIIFCRMNPNDAANNWNNKWNQTSDLKVPTDGTNLYTVAENAWDKGDGVWSVYTPVVVEPVALATPVVTAEINDDYVTLYWESIDGAENYTATYGDKELVVEGTSATFDAVVGTITATVVANPADTTANTASEAGTVEVVVEAPAVAYTTVAEFLALSGDDVIPSDATDDVIAAAPRYTLKGTITSVTQTTYGNFYLNDGTGEVLIYGLCSPEGEAKYWAASGAKVGDDIVVKTIRTEYNNAPQGKNATFVELLPGTLAFWSFDATATSFTAAGGDKEIGLAIYNATAEVVATSDNAQFSAAYADGTLTITALENTTEEVIEGTIIVICGSLSQTITVSQAAASSGDQTAVEAEVVFTKDNRTTFTTSQQVFEANGIKVINDKASSTSPVADYAAPARFYKNSKVTVSAPGNITTIVFDCNSASYATALNTSGLTGTVSVSADKVTVTLDGSSNEYVISSLTGGQVRMDGVTVTYLQ